MTSANRSATRVVEETSFGVTPDNPQFTEIPVTSNTLAATYESVTSNTIRADGNIAGQTRTFQSSAGDIVQELSYRAHDIQLQDLFRNTFNRKPQRDGSSEITAVSTTTYTITDGSAFAPGDLVSASGFAREENNKVFVAAATTSSTQIVTTGLVAETPSGDFPRLMKVGVQAAEGDIACVISGNAITSTALDFTTLGLTIGQSIKLGGTGAAFRFATEGNNAVVRVSGISANRLDLEEVPTSWVADNGAGKTIKIWIFDSLTNAQLVRSSTVERQTLEGADTTYEYFTGQNVGGFSMAMSPAGLITLTFSYIGKVPSASDSRLSGATTKLLPANPLISTSTNVQSVRFADADLAAQTEISDLTLTVDNAASGVQVVSLDTFRNIDKGFFNVSGTMEVLFVDRSLYQKILNDERVPLALVIQDNDGRTFILDLARMYLEGSLSVDGINTNLTLSISFTAELEDSLGYTMAWQQSDYMEL